MGNSETSDSEAPKHPPIDLTDPAEGMSDAERTAYWHAQTPDARLAEVMRLNYLKYGDVVFGPIARTPVVKITLKDKT
jgi:hypothetical protein